MDNMQFNRVVHVKPGSMAKVIEIGPKFIECAKKILGEDAPQTTMYVRMFGPLNQVKWCWENDSVDQEMTNLMKINKDPEWAALAEEFAEHIVMPAPMDYTWAQVYKG